jgi:6-phosphogluconolactonase/glucosamine-6-phosphate isomerase/deaminase
VILLASGEEKSEVLREVLRGEEPGALPASRLFPKRGRVTWLVDAAAASALAEGKPE